MSVRILGIDPGSRVTGFGIVDLDTRLSTYVTSGCIRVSGDTLPERLKCIFEELSEIIMLYRPDEVAVENVFMHRNAGSALKLGQARGAAICAAVVKLLPVSEYAPAEIKQTVVGRGRAEKEQVQHMVKVLLNLPSSPQADAADALATALCHCHTRQTLSRIGAAQ